MNNDLLHAETGVLAKVRKTGYSNLDQAKGRLPFLASTIIADPCFRDPGKKDFRLEAGSPAIDTGLIIPGVNDNRFYGKAPDMGAIETNPAP